MSEDISALGWLVIVCCLAFGYGTVWFAVQMKQERDEQRSRKENAGHQRPEDRQQQGGDQGSGKDGTEAPAREGGRAPGATAGDAEHWTTVLGVRADATQDEVRVAYRKKISQYHPDRVAQMGEELRDLASRLAAKINEAYATALRERGFRNE